MAACQPIALCPGHGGPVIGEAAKIYAMLTETADFLDTIVSRTLAAMEAGSPPHVDIVTGIALPVSDSPWLQPVYDDTEFLVRNTIRFYGGWWSGRPSELKPAPREAPREGDGGAEWWPGEAGRARGGNREERRLPARVSLGRLRARSRTRRQDRARKSRRALRRAREDGRRV